MNTDFGKRITELRKQKGLSQKELGDILGVSNKAVSKWENNESLPKTATMIKLAELFEIDANELIGRDSTASNYDNTKYELEMLKSENAVLSTKLEAIGKRRKRALITVAFICIMGIVASGIIAFCFVGDKSINSAIKDAGKSNTKIVLCEHNFITPDEVQGLLTRDDEFSSNILYGSNFSDEKYAKYFDSDGNEHKVLVQSNRDDSFVILKVGNKSYYYLNEDMQTDLIEPCNINQITIENDYSDYNYLIDDFASNYYSKEFDYYFIEEFCKFYNSKGDPVDSRITELNLDRNAPSVYIGFEYSVSEEYGVSYVEFGKLFKDGENNTYFLDYATNNTYKVGKELMKYVE